MIVADASAIVQACLSKVDLEGLGQLELVAPPLLWSEVTSALHELRWRREISAALADRGVERFRELRVGWRRPARLYEEAWRLANQFGWAKTYDAEYVALALLLRCRLLTIDSKLLAVASRVAEVIGPAELTS